jgi:4-hydroxy-tetrahydrodipicolinate reductase
VQGVFKDCDVAIDFSVPDAAAVHAKLAAVARKPFVCGVTGMGEAQQRLLQDAAKHTAIFYSANMSRGVFVLNHLMREAAQMLGPEYEIEIAEAHHNKKADAPSGTALVLARTVAKARGLKDSDFVYGREGQTGERAQNKIGIHALRMGDIVGEHTGYFAAPYERLELTHRATNRAVFARGALDCLFILP